MFGQFKNTKKQGDFALGIAIGWFSAEGYTVSVPLTDSQDYDLIVDIDDEIKRVQVKSTFYKTNRGIYNVGLSLKGGNRSSIGRLKPACDLKYDLLFVVAGFDNKYLIPKKEIAHIRSSINLGSRYSQYRIG
jgi:PD-(D/E)XK endonuclease